MAEVVAALAYLRTKEIVHRDLKPGNIVLDQDYHLKLIDFGTCKVFNTDLQTEINAYRKKIPRNETCGEIKLARVNSLVGTEEYLAPETLDDTEVSYACDYWSLGVILYQLLCGVTPFKGTESEATFQNIRDFSEINYPKGIVIDPVAKSLIEQLLIKDPRQRLGYNDIEEIMNHPYFTGINWH